MLYLANPSTSVVRDAMGNGLLGMIAVPRQGNGRTIPTGAVWCADNGCFSPTGWVGYDRWFAWLDSYTDDERERCLFATAPDVVGDAAATLARSAPWLPRIRGIGYPAALVAQDGLTPDTVPWSTFDVLFVGGTTDWKVGPEARALVAEARRRGVPVHMGRVNSLRRLRYAEAIGCDTVDGTFITFGPDVNLPRMLGYLDVVHGQPGLFEATS